MNVPKVETAAAQRLKVVDCDIHPTQKRPQDIYPYLSKRWRDHLDSYGGHVRQSNPGQLSYPRMVANGMRVDAFPDDGPPGSDLALMQRQHLDANGIETGMLIALSRGGMEERNPDLAAALSHASNEWQLDTFVRPEPRLKAGIVVAQDNPPEAVAEIERRAGDTSFVQVIMSTRAVEPLGSRKYWPIYAAAEAAGLPMGLHPAGFSGGHPSTGSGWPSYYYQEHYTFVPGTESIVTSLVIEGVFERFPRLKVALIEGGFSWAPALGWRMDKHWERFRAEVPHLKRPPSEYMREHIWWTTQPIEEPPRPRQILDVVGWLGWDRLMFSSDYPHWDFDDPAQAFKFPMTETQSAQVFGGNARGLYGLG
jgi:predicted TIM-barrel fold metal-dependent hydrolase